MIVQVVAGATVHVLPPGEAVAVYPLIDEVPELDGATQVTRICLSPIAAFTLVGGPGVVVDDNGFRATLDADGGPVPAILVAVTVNV